MEKKIKRPRSLRELLEEFFSQSGLSRRIQEEKILDIWEEVVGEAVAARTEPICVKNRILQVKVESSVWMQQLQFMKGLIIQKLHDRLGDHPLQDLRFLLGEIERAEKWGEKRSEANPENPVELSDADRERIEKEVAAIQDPEMRNILTRVYGKGLKTEKAAKERKYGGDES